MFTPCVPRIARARRRRRQSPFASIHRTTRVPTAPRASPATIDLSRARLPRHRARASPPAVVPRALASPRETLSRLGLPPSPAARVLPPLPRARPRARPARAVVASNEIFSRTFAPSAGPIGGGWAAHYLAQGYEVTSYLHDAAEYDALLRLLETAWVSLEQIGLADGASMDRFRWTTDLAEATAAAEFIQESVPEVLTLKQGLYKTLGDIVDSNVVIASSTSRRILRKAHL